MSTPVTTDVPVVDDPGGPVLVVSAHPDDEVLAAGAWLAAQCGRDVTFVTATDGEASHPGSPTTSPEELRRRRPLELAEALSRLGHAEAPVHRLGLPDGGLAGHVDDLARALAPHVARASVVLATFRHDGHPDHDAVGAVAADLCRDGTVLWELPLWSWVWDRPAEQAWRSRARVLPSRDAHRALKRVATEAFASQVRPLSDHPSDAAVVTEALLSHALHEPEVVVVR